MEDKRVKDVMIPLEDYPLVSQNKSLYEAMLMLNEAQKNLKPNMRPPRALLVIDDEGKIIGKLGHLAMLKAFEPKYKNFEDMDKLTRAELSSDFISSIRNYMELWQHDIYDTCQLAQATKVSDIMKPIDQHIDVNETLYDAVHKIIMWQTISILVTDGNGIVGIIRLTDIYDEVSQYVIKNCKTS